MAVSWPASLPRSLIEPSVAPGDGRLKSQTDTGPGKVRRRSSAMAGKLSGSLVLSYQQRQTLQDFIDGELAGGTLPFWFPDQATGLDMLVRFGDSLPGWTRYGFGKVTVNIDLEVLP